MEKALNLIGGQELPAQDGAILVPPGFDDVEVASSGILDLVSAIQAANKAWTVLAKSDLPPTRTRLTFLENLRTRLDAEKDALTRLEALETSETLACAADSWARLDRALEMLANRLASASEPGAISPQAIFTRHELPAGLVGVITPSYDVIYTLGLRVAAALASGACVIAKPSHRAARTASRLGHAILSAATEAGLPAGVFNLVQGRGSEVGEALVSHPGIHTLVFAGSTETGRAVAKGAAEFLKRVQLSLGSVNSAIVFAEADLKKTSEAVARLAFSSHVPKHLRVSRIFIQEGIYREFLDQLKTAAQALKSGDVTAPGIDLGPLRDPADQRRFQDACAQAVKEKGKPLFEAAGEELRPAAFFDASLCSTLQQEEIPGPFALIESFKYQHDALKHLISSPFGQAAYVFHSQIEKAQRFAQKLEVGRVFINSPGPLWEPQIDVTGLKGSGLGAEGVDAYLKFFSKPVVIGLSL